MWARILNEPTLLIEAVRGIVLLVVVLGWWKATDGQQMQVIGTISAILAVLNRALVTPNTSLSAETQARAKMSPPWPPA